jgi:hypothetical protein
MATFPRSPVVARFSSDDGRARYSWQYGSTPYMLAPPPANYNWPNPRIEQRQAALSSQVQQPQIAAPPTPAPFIYDWPNPRPWSNAAALGSQVRQPQIAAPVLSPFVYDWPNPRPWSNAAALTSQIQQPLALYLPLSGLIPVPAYWGNPTVQPRPASLLTHIDFQRTPPPVVALPVANYSWPNPLPEERLAILTAHRQHQNPLPTAAPFTYDWPNPRRDGLSVPTILPVNLALLTTPATPPPFLNFDWPNPRRDYPQTPQAPSLNVALAVAPLPSLPPYAYDWPNPRRESPQQPPVTPSNVTLLTAIPVKPPPSYDWPNPREVALHSSARTWVQKTAGLLLNPILGTAVAVPRETPRGPAFAWVAESHTPYLPIPQAPLNAYDLSGPLPPIRPKEFFTWISGNAALLLTPPPVPPPFSAAWSNPRDDRSVAIRDLLVNQTVRMPVTMAEIVSVQVTWYTGSVSTTIY